MVFRASLDWYLTVEHLHFLLEPRRIPPSLNVLPFEAVLTALLSEPETSITHTDNVRGLWRKILKIVMNFQDTKTDLVI